jgi:undecaprenol kinase
LRTLTDLASPEIHPLAKIAKDSAAAAVLVLAIFSMIVGLIIFIPYLLEVYKQFS